MILLLAVTREELGPAVATWYDHAKDMKEDAEKAQSSACVLL